MSKSKSIRLSLYLATHARGSRQDRVKDLDFNQISRPSGPVVWFHTGSDTKAGPVCELAKRIASERDDITFLVTSLGAENESWRGDVARWPVPDDNLESVKAFLDFWRPDVAIWTETDLRPALISLASDRHVPLFLVETQSSNRAEAQGWPKGLSAELLGKFLTILTGDENSKAVLSQMGASPGQIETLGFLEEGAPALPCNEAERDDLAMVMAGRPAWLAASVAQDEFGDVISAHEQAQRRSHRLLLMLVPKDLTHGPEWAAKLIEQGYSVTVRSLGEEPEPDTQIYIADTENEMGLWYRLAPISFLGQSLHRGGGINPFEAASLGSAIVHGTYIENHHASYHRLATAKAACLVHDGAELGDAVDQLLSPARAAELASQAWGVTTSGADVTDRTIDLILTELEKV